MKLCQITILVIYGIGLLINAHQHGKQKDGKHNFWIYLISTSIAFSLLYGAGAFNKIIP